MSQQKSIFGLERAAFFYEPYPIGIIKEVFEPSYYGELLRQFPSLDLFRFMQYHGDKYSLSEVNNPDKYFSFLDRTPAWRLLYDYVKGPHFIPDILDLLDKNGIALGIASSAHAVRRLAPMQMLRRRLISMLRAKDPSLSARFEFSAMPVQGGNILPHTDSPQKIVTLVLSMRGDDWDPLHGGGTEVMRPLDPAKSFNFLNKYLAFDEVETVREMPFDANQCVIFVKTFNSLHAVRPMRGPTGKFRRTLTINIETETL